MLTIILPARGLVSAPTVFRASGRISPGTFNRGSYAGYLDLEAEVLKDVLLGLAGRYEDFERVGDTLNGKASVRWQALDADLVRAALRGSVSSGFRAPTVGGKPTSATSQPRLPEACYRIRLPCLRTIRYRPSRVGKKLEPEKSVNYSVGTVFSVGKLDVTVDYFRIKVQGRIQQGSPQPLTDSDIAALLAQGVQDASSYSSVVFFSNALDTTTQGVDVVASYPLQTFAGHTQFTLVGNWTDTKIDSFDSDVIVSGERFMLRNNLPEFRFTLTADHTWGPWRLLVAAALLRRVLGRSVEYRSCTSQVNPVNAGSRTRNSRTRS